MHSPCSFILRTGIVAVALSVAGLGHAFAGDVRCPNRKETLTGAFVGTPKITVDPATGKQSVLFDGVGVLSGMGDALCTTTDEIFDPSVDPAVGPQVYGHHTLTGDNGDGITIWFESTKVTSDAVLDANGIPVIIYIKIEAEWTITGGTGRYRGAIGTGTLYVDAWAKPTGPLNLEGIGNWAMWGEVECKRPSRFHWGCRR